MTVLKIGTLRRFDNAAIEEERLRAVYSPLA